MFAKTIDDIPFFKLLSPNQNDKNENVVYDYPKDLRMADKELQHVSCCKTLDVDLGASLPTAIDSEIVIA